MPPTPVRRFRIGVQNDEPVRLGVSEILIYSKDAPDISYAIAATFERVEHVPEGPPPRALAAARSDRVER